MMKEFQRKALGIALAVACGLADTSAFAAEQDRPFAQCTDHLHSRGYDQPKEEQGGEHRWRGSEVEKNIEKFKNHQKKLQAHKRSSTNHQKYFDKPLHLNSRLFLYYYHKFQFY